ncbi:MAG: FAD-dependent oxidoreductase [Candidatus Aminicenantes bacterium]
MKRDISGLASTEFDLVIIGGGITGACLAHDAASRGMKVAVVEKGDFGGATSSASSKILHGGIRFLQQGQLRRVRECARERSYFQNLAPHLTTYVPFIIPTYKGMKRSKLLLSTAMAVYELLCLGQNKHIKDCAKKVAGSRSLSKAEVQELLPGIASQKMTGGLLFYESLMHSPERMTLAFLETAAHNGAVIANYIKAKSLLRVGDRLMGICAQDLLNEEDIEIRARLVVNAAGPWIPSINKLVNNDRMTGVVAGFSKGAHIITRSLTDEYGVALPTRKKHKALISRGGRHIFIIPWRGRSLIGTTYAPYEGPLESVRATESDVMELIHELNTALEGASLKRQDVLFAYAGIYPLVEGQVNHDVYQGTHRDKIVDHARSDGLEGLVSVLGARYTSARALAEKALNLIVKKFDRPYKPCQTRSTPLLSGNIPDLNSFIRDKKREYSPIVDGKITSHLITYYGASVDRLLSLIRNKPELGKRLSPRHDVIEAEVVHAVKYEMAHHLDDVVFRRTGLGTLGSPGLDVIKRCAELMGSALGWDWAAREQEISSTTAKFISWKNSCEMV